MSWIVGYYVFVAVLSAWGFNVSAGPSSKTERAIMIFLALIWPLVVPWFAVDLIRGKATL